MAKVDVRKVKPRMPVVSENVKSLAFVKRVQNPKNDDICTYCLQFHFFYKINLVKFEMFFLIWVMLKLVFFLAELCITKKHDEICLVSL